MDAARQQEIYGAALDITDASERSAMLDRACAGDPVLRRQLDELLAVTSQAEGFFTECFTAIVESKEDFDASARAPGAGQPGAAKDTLADAIDSQIGGYRLLQTIGEGGCGAVYLAEQERPVHRRVALKVIKLGMDTKSVMARFAAEQQALALMDHPNIARVFDAGATDSGRPYFVMELVVGTKLTSYCDQHQLDIRARLDLFMKVCHAIQHAHQKGIIHRDIKPSNILVATHDGVAAPKVIDFGIAKAIEGRLTDQTVFTPSEHFMGTPAYMSPEQADFSSLDVDTRSDIYSLGVLLYELLTGRTPFNQKELIASGMDAMRRTLREQEPLAPSIKLKHVSGGELAEIAAHRHCEPMALSSMLSGDLDWIVMKALEKDRRRRYETANGLALDLKRYLENEPVGASPPSRLYRLQKLVRRNRVTFAAGSVVAVALLVCSVVSTWLLLKEREAHRQAETAERQKNSFQKEAERLDQLRRAAEDRQKLLEASSLFTRGDREKADALLAQFTSPKPTDEFAAMYRELGDWHAIGGRLQVAADRFQVLIQINQNGTSDTTLDDSRYAPLLVELGQTAEYERFRESLIARYAGTENPIIAERVVKACLLKPANVELMRALGRYIEVAESSFKRSRQDEDRVMASWRSYSLALMEYRRGNYQAATEWCQRSRAFNAGVQSCLMSVQIIQAMADAQLGRTQQAQAELAEARSVVEATFKQGVMNHPRWEGFWFDWVFARVHLREAESTLP